MAQYAALGFAVLALMQIIAIAGQPAFDLLWVKSGVTLGSAALLWSYTRRNYPRRWNPLAEKYLRRGDP